MIIEEFTSKTSHARNPYSIAILNGKNGNKKDFRNFASLFLAILYDVRAVVNGDPDKPLKREKIKDDQNPVILIEGTDREFFLNYSRYREVFSENANLILSDVIGKADKDLQSSLPVNSVKNATVTKPQTRLQEPARQ